MPSGERSGNWGTTYTGGVYWPDDPRPEDINIEDIAHALSMQCRFGGHVRRFYSVAEHSVHVSRLVQEHGSAHDAMWGLLHDGSEAYLVDIPRPVKLSQYMIGYYALESRMMRAVCKKFDLDHSMPACVRDADEIMLATEAHELMPGSSVARWTLTHAPLKSSPIMSFEPLVAKRLFLDRFYELNSRRARR